MHRAVGTQQARGYTVLILIAYRRHIYTTIQLGNWFPFSDPLQRHFYSKDAHQWNHSETATPKTWICNIMNILMTHDQTANEKNINMVLCKFIQSRRAEMPRDNRSWITMNHVYMHCVHCTHSLQLTARTVPVYVRVYAMHCNAWRIPFQNFVSTVLVYVIGTREHNVIIFQFQVASIIIWKLWNMPHV